MFFFATGFLFLLAFGLVFFLFTFGFVLLFFARFFFLREVVFFKRFFFFKKKIYCFLKKFVFRSFFPQVFFSNVCFFQRAFFRKDILNKVCLFQRRLFFFKGLCIFSKVSFFLRKSVVFYVFFLQVFVLPVVLCFFVCFCFYFVYCFFGKSFFFALGFVCFFKRFVFSFCKEFCVFVSRGFFSKMVLCLSCLRVCVLFFSQGTLCFFWGGRFFFPVIVCFHLKWCVFISRDVFFYFQRVVSFFKRSSFSIEVCFFPNRVLFFSLVLGFF